MCIQATTALMLASAGSSLIQFQQAKAQQKAQFIAQKRQNDIAKANAIRRYATEQLKIRQTIAKSSEKGFIVIHDLLPRNWLEEHVPRFSSTWCGDIWNISFDLLKTENIKFELLFKNYRYMN